MCIRDSYYKVPTPDMILVAVIKLVFYQVDHLEPWATGSRKTAGRSKWYSPSILVLMSSSPITLSLSRLGDNCQILAVRSDICKIRQLSDRSTVSGTTVSGPWTTVRRNCQCSEKTVRSYSFRSDNCKILQFRGGQSLQFFPISRRWQKVELNENNDELLINSNCTKCLSLFPFTSRCPWAQIQ